MAQGNDTETDKSFAKSRKRISGIEKATDRLTKEEVEIDEAKSRLSFKPETHAVAVEISKDGDKKTIDKFKYNTADVGDKTDAIHKARKHFEGKGFKVHSLWHAGKVNEEVELDEAVKVSSSSKQNYEWSNGKKPSGHGRWMFSTIEPRKHDVRNDEHMKNTYTSSFASFGDASKEAAKHFKAAGHVGEIHVLS